jgi:hypothetical protein
MTVVVIADGYEQQRQQVVVDEPGGLNTLTFTLEQ